MARSMASMLRSQIRALLIAAIVLIFGVQAAPALAQGAPTAEVQTSWRLLDYIAVE